MLRLFVATILALFPSPQEVFKPESKKLVLPMPIFYATVTNGGGNLIPMALNRPVPEADKNEYFIQTISADGKNRSVPELVGHDGFYEKIVDILSYGVKDSADYTDPAMNEGYRDILILLFKEKILDFDGIKQLSQAYTSRNWAESAYWLDEAFPGVVPVDAWLVLRNKEVLPYRKLLMMIKLAKTENKDLVEVRKWYDAELEKTPDNQLSFAAGFGNFAKGYGLLAKLGIMIPENIRDRIFLMYLAIDKDLSGNFAKLYVDLSLPMPSKGGLRDLLVKRINSELEPTIHLVGIFRNLKFPFPKERVSFYAEAILDRFGSDHNFEDLLYLFSIPGVQIMAERIKSYADDALDWHQRTEDRLGQKDTQDYFHMAVLCYQKMLAVKKQMETRLEELSGIREINEAQENEKRTLRNRISRIGFSQERKACLLQALDSFDVRMFDLLIVFELLGLDPKTEPWSFKIEGRLKKIPAGFKDFSVPAGGAYVVAPSDRFGRTILPFREELEYAAFLNDPEFTRNLFNEMSDWLVSQLRYEGGTLLRCYAETRCSDLNGQGLDFFQAELAKFDCGPAPMIVAEWIALCQEINWHKGLVNLAYCFHDLALERSALKCFDLIGLGEEARAGYYGRGDESYWVAREKLFYYEMRLHGRFQSVGKK